MGGKAAEDSAMPNASPIPSYRTSRRWTKEEAVAALAALAASGLSMRAFASREGFDVQRLYLWRRKLEKKNKPAQPPFIEALEEQEGC
jgi:transposase-like protein